MNWKTKALLVVICILGIYVGYLNHSLKKEYSVAASLQVTKDSTRSLLDLTRVRLTTTSANKDSLSDALNAANELNGRLVAAANVRLTPKPVADTTSRGTVIVDQTRTLHYSDTTDAGTMDANIVAPPFPANLQFGYVYRPAPLLLTLALIQLRNDSVVVGVRYRGGEATIGAPFAKVPAPPKRFTPYVEGLYSLVDRSFDARAGVQILPPFLVSWTIVGELEQRIRAVNNESSLFVGVRKTF